VNQRRLLQLVRDNAAPRAGVTVKAEGDEATILLYDVIDPWWGVAAKDFIAALNGITAPTIHLRINSPGGDVFEARAIATAVRQHKSTVISHIDGLAASAATYIAIAGKEVEMADGSFFMIHQAWALALGNADDMLAMADLLEKVDGSILTDYMKKTGKSKDELVAWMQAETWFTAQEAKDAGFVDRIAAVDANGGAANAAAWNVSAYKNAPKALTQAKQPSESFDRAALERRLSMYEKANRIAA
jgi:ATP-dependent Clp protease, protease subunit